LKFDNDKALFQFALSKLSQVHDPDELICDLAAEEAASNLGHSCTIDCFCQF
jgi:hypothetical protein